MSVAIVTGAALGIGLETARHLLDDGYAVVVSDVDRENLDRAAAMLDGEVLVHVADLSVEDGARGLVDAAMDWKGRIDLLVNNAGGGVILPFLEHTAETIEQTISRNLLTTIHCCRMVIPVMIEQGGGRIVNVGAESCRNGLYAHAMYNGAKGGVHAITSGLAREFAEHGITVNCVAPSIVATEAAQAMIDDPGSLSPAFRKVIEQALADIPSGRAATMAEVAATIAFLGSEAASFVTGQVVSVNGGSSMQ